MMRRAVAIPCGLVAISCGRLGFEETPAHGGGDVSGDGLPICAHTFCDDFERSVLTTGWDRADNTGAAVLSLEDTGGEHRYVVELPSPQLESGFLVKQFAPPTASGFARVAFDLSYATATPGTAEIDLVQLRWDELPPTCSQFGFFLVRDGTGPFDLQETYPGCGGNEDTRLLDLANLAPRRVDMKVRLGPKGTARIFVEVDGVNRVDKLLSHAVLPSTLTLRVGAGAVRNMAAPWTIGFDNLTVDVE